MKIYMKNKTLTWIQVSRTLDPSAILAITDEQKNPGKETVQLSTTRQ
jgi:hypothetical protein